MRSRSAPSISPQEVLIAFGSFELDIARRELRKLGAAVALPPKALELLILLASARGRIVEKQEIIDALWPGVAVEDGNLTQTVFLLRKTLGESTDAPVHVITVPRRGYRFQGIIESPPPQPLPARRALGKIVAAGGAVLAVPSLVWFVQSKAAPPIPRRLVVLPFLNMSADSNTEYFSDGLTEELINVLAGLDGLQVVARTTAFQFKGKPADIRRIGEQLNVDAVLEGSVRRQGDVVRVTAQLNSTKNGYHFWSKTFEHDVKDTFAVQKAIAASVGESFQKPTGASRSGAVPVEAYNLYLRGLHERNKVFDGAVERSIELFEKAIAKAPDFAEAYAAIAQAYSMLGYTEQWPPTKAFPKAKENWTRAWELNNNLAGAHSARAITLLLYDYDLPGAEASFQRAISLNPSYADAHHWYSHCLVVRGRLDESLRESRLALELDPLSMDTNAHLSWHYFMARDFQQSINAAKSGLAIDPNHVPTKIFLIWSLTASNQIPEALDVLAQLAKREDIEKWKNAFRTGGAEGFWKARLAYRIEQTKAGNVSALAIAECYVALNRHEEAIDWLEKGFKDRIPQIIHIKTDPRFAPLLQNPRFQKLTRAIGLP